MISEIELIMLYAYTSKAKILIFQKDLWKSYSPAVTLTYKKGNQLFKQ